MSELENVINRNQSRHQKKIVIYARKGHTIDARRFFFLFCLINKDSDTKELIFS